MERAARRDRQGRCWLAGSLLLLAACAGAHSDQRCDGGDRCVAAPDAGPGCEGVTCDPPPPAECVDGTTLRTYGAGTCEDGTCRYAPVDTTCARGCQAGACRFDPAACPVGVADGCCGLIQYGGTDPDCPSLDCDLQLGQPVAFDDVPLPTSFERSGVALAWLGDRLVTARIDQDPDDASAQRYILEYRDASGAVQATHEDSCPASLCAGRNGPTRLAYEPTSDRFLFAHPGVGVDHWVILDGNGQEVWSRDLGVDCIGSRANQGVFAAHGEFLAVWQDQSCDINDLTRGTRLQRIGVDGTLGFTVSPSRRSAYAASFACGAGCDRVAWYYANSSWEPQAAAHELATFQTAELTVGTSLFGGMDFSAMAFDGTRYFVAALEWPSQATGQRLRTQYLDPTTGWIGSPVLSSSDTTQWQVPRMVWTGDGYVMASSILSRGPDCNGGTQCRPNRHIELVQFRTDGTVRRRFWVEPLTQGSLMPDLVWAGGRIALTWVSAPQQGPERRFLAYLECAP
jgi:hypothetical protein